jgi:hypothetical protein
MLAADSVDTLKSTHPHYFRDGEPYSGETEALLVPAA